MRAVLLMIFTVILLQGCLAYMISRDQKASSQSQQHDGGG